MFSKASRRQKEQDERNEVILRSLLKLPGNESCINCGSLGPEFVCLNFSIFVCSFCSGIHREFSHRVESITMARFTAAEISGLQSGGNNRARKLYLKTWSSSNKLPECNNLDQIRQFVKLVYELQELAGDKLAPNDDTVRAFSQPPKDHMEREISEKVLRQLLQPPVARKIHGSQSNKSTSFTPNRVERAASMTNIAARLKTSPSSVPSPGPSVKKSSSTSFLDLMTTSSVDVSASRSVEQQAKPSEKAAPPKSELPTEDLIDFVTEVPTVPGATSTDLLFDTSSQSSGGQATALPELTTVPANPFQWQHQLPLQQPYSLQGAHYQSMQQQTAASQSFYYAEIQPTKYYPSKKQSVNPFDL